MVFAEDDQLSCKGSGSHRLGGTQRAGQRYLGRGIDPPGRTVMLMKEQSVSEPQSPPPFYSQEEQRQGLRLVISLASAHFR